MLLIPNPIELFYSYAHRDENLRKKLEEQLSILKRQNLIIDKKE